MTEEDRGHWIVAAQEAGWTDIDNIMAAIEAVAHKLDGPRAEPLVFCCECGGPLLDGHYERFADIDFAITQESWSGCENGQHFCRDRDHEGMGLRRHLSAVQPTNIKIRRAGRSPS